MTHAISWGGDNLTGDAGAYDSVGGLNIMGGNMAGDAGVYYSMGGLNHGGAIWQGTPEPMMQWESYIMGGI